MPRRGQFRPTKAVPRSLNEEACLNIGIGNPDDHAQNHAVFWGGRYVELALAYDRSPLQPPRHALAEVGLTPAPAEVEISARHQSQQR